MVRMTYDRWKQLCDNALTKNSDVTYKIDDHDEDQTFVNNIWVKNNLNNAIMNGDFEKAKEITEKMNNKKSTNNIYAVINGEAYAPVSIGVNCDFRGNSEYSFIINPKSSIKVENAMFSIENVIFNPPATIVFWGDGSKTVVKCQNGEEFDPEKGLTMAFFKRMHGNKGHYFEEIKKWTKKYDEEYPSNSKGVTIEFSADNWADMFKKLRTIGTLVNPMNITEQKLDI